MRRNLDLYRNSSETFSGVLRQPDGAARDLTSATLTWRLGTRDGCTTSLTLTESNGITISAPTTGAWSITIDPADTDDLTPGLYQHIGQAVIGSATYIFTQGRVRIRKELE